MYTGIMNPKLIVHQKITAIVNRYAIYTPDADGEKGDLVAFAQQKRMALKEKISFYSSEDRTTLLFTLRAEKVLDVHGSYFVEDQSGNLIGAFRKNFKKSLLVSSWTILNDNNEPVMEVAENNTALAIIRRFIGFIPIVGEFLDIIVAFFRYHFSFRPEGTNEEAGIYKKTTLFRDRYTLFMNDDTYAATDWRVFAALAVALDALESR